MGSERWVERTAAAAERRLSLAVVVGLCVACACIALAVTRTVTPLTALALLGLVFLVRKYVDLQVDIVGMKRRGADAEVAVGRRLDALIAEGYFVIHDIQNVVPGNIDHVVGGPTGVLLIETKSRRFRPEDLRRTKDAARRVAGETGVPFVIPVMCLHLRPGVQWRQEKVDIVGIDRLNDFIRSRRRPPADPDDFMGLAGRG